MITVLEGLGVVCIAVVGLQLCKHAYKLLYSYVIGPVLQKNVNFSEYGRWAVVTGATDGIGKACAELLAQKGMDIVMISRTMSKLETVAADLEATYKIRTKVIEADFSDPSPEVYSKIEKELNTLKPSPLVLVNNVGMSYPYPEYLTGLPEKDSLYMEIICCNIVSVTSMTKLLLPYMQEEKRGVIINISSTSAIIPSPMLSVYSASKDEVSLSVGRLDSMAQLRSCVFLEATDLEIINVEGHNADLFSVLYEFMQSYVHKFSKDMAIECEKNGIVVQCLVPGYVATKMSKIKNSTWMAPSPEVYVEKALSTTGIQKVTTGYFPHSLLVGTVQLIESICPQFAAWIIVRTMENIRSRALHRRAAT